MKFFAQSNNPIGHNNYSPNPRESPNKQIYAYILGAAKFFRQHKKEATVLVRVWEEDIYDGNLIAYYKLQCTRILFAMDSGPGAEALFYLRGQRCTTKPRKQKPCGCGF